MRIRTGQKMDQDPNPDLDPGYFFMIYWNVLIKQNLQIFLVYFNAKKWIIQNSGNFFNLCLK